MKDARRELGCEKKKKNAGFALLILAGLTGGSGEGYVLDLVNSANDIGAVDETAYFLAYFGFTMSIVKNCLIWIRD